jgi:hypothetical protein
MTTRVQRDFFSRREKVDLNSLKIKVVAIPTSVRLKMSVDTVMAPVHSDTGTDVATLGFEFQDTMMLDQ